MARIAAKNGETYKEQSAPQIATVSKSEIPIDLVTLQNKDPELETTEKSLIEGRTLPPSYERERKFLSINEGLLVHKKPVERWVTPSFIRKDIVEYMHRISGHAATEKVIGMVRESHWWSGIRQTVEEVCDRCLICAQMNPSPQKCKALLDNHFLWKAHGLICRLIM